LTNEKELKDEIYAKFRSKVENELKKDLKSKDMDSDEQELKPVTSRQYDEFRNSFMPKSLSIYEKLCNFSEKTFNLPPDKKKVAQIQEDLDTCHLKCTPTGVSSFAILGPMLFIIIFSILGYIIPFFLEGSTEGSFFFVVFSFIIGLILIVPLGKYPNFLATTWRMKASNQMVLSIFYISTYMRQNSNLELAIDFAAEHLAPPLSFDLKKLIWDVETHKHNSIKDSLDEYLEFWKKHNREYIESMHLIISSLYETSETRRLDALDKAIEVILEETEEKMMHYAHNLKTPLDTLNMLGIVLPVLGLVILPLMVSFMPEVKWYHLAAVYNIVLPVAVYYLGKNILATRPSGYGHVDLTTKQGFKDITNVNVKFGNKNMVFDAKTVAIFVFAIVFFIGIFPLLLHLVEPDFDLVVVPSEGRTIITQLSNVEDPITVQHYFQGYRDNGKGRVIGPFGLGATLLSLFVPLAIGLAIGLYYKFKSSDVIKIRGKTKKLDDEFASALFQLGNRLGDGLPPEMAFSKVSEVMEGTVSGDFFMRVSINIRKLGMSVKRAIFDKKEGAINEYPSNLIETSMKILIESAKKGSMVASQALINVSNYVKRMHRVDERLKDLMTDVVSSMNAQIKFLTPIIAGVVIGITSMITTILGSLSTHMESLQGIGTDGAAGGMQAAGLLEMFNAGVPTYYFQVIVGLYVVQIVYILTVISNGIMNGEDKLNEKYQLGKNMVTSTILYTVIAGIVILIFNLIAGSILIGLV
jgi:hypothetical protein